MPDNISFKGMTAGQMLRAARESRGLSVDDVCEKLKIRHAVIEALENDQSSSLKMAPVFVKGHARALAEHLGVPADIFKSALDSGAAYSPSPMLQDEAKLAEVASMDDKNSSERKKSSASGSKEQSGANRVFVLGAMAAAACGCLYFALAGGQPPVSDESQPKSDVKVDVYEFEGMADIDVSKVDSENFDPNAYAPTADLTADSIKNRPQEARLEEFRAMQQGKEVPLTAVTGQTAKEPSPDSLSDAKSEPKAQGKEDEVTAPSSEKIKVETPSADEKHALADEKTKIKNAVKAEAPKGEDPNAPKKLIQDELLDIPQEGEIEVAIPMNEASAGREAEKKEQKPDEAQIVSEKHEPAKIKSEDAASDAASDKKQEQIQQDAADAGSVTKDIVSKEAQKSALKPEGSRSKGTLEIDKADSYKISFSFKDECWVEVKSAGKVVASKLNPAGSSLEATAQEAPVSLKFGAPQAVVLSINGKPVDLSGAKPGSLYRLEISAK